MSTYPPLRIAHIADTHLGARGQTKLDPETGRNQRAIDVERAFEAAIDDIVTRRPDLVIHAGDIFNHTRPTWPALRCFARQMRRLADAGIQVVVIAGNHDVPRIRTSGTAFSFLEIALPSIQFVAGYEAEPVKFEEFGLVVHAIPHNSVSLDAAGPAAYATRGFRNILLVHGMVPGMSDITRVEAGQEDIEDTLLDTGFDYIALGHFHEFRQVRANAWYSGATERFSFLEEKSIPGYAWVTFAEGPGRPTVEHIPIPTRRLVTLKPVDGADLPARAVADTALDRARKLGDPTALARIELRDVSHAVRREVDGILKREAEGIVWALVTMQRGDKPAFLGERPASTTTVDPLVLFDAFVEERRAGGLYDDRFATAIRDRGRVALEQALRDELESAAEAAE
jgi:DNA repair protein SbcD/Mre11